MKTLFNPSAVGLSHPNNRPGQWSVATIYLLFCLALPQQGLSQRINPVPPAEGFPLEKRISLMKKRSSQPPPMPADGFWVVTERKNGKIPALVSYYTAQQHLITTDTMTTWRVNIHRTAVVYRLNERLRELLDTYPTTELVIYQKIQ